MAEMAIFFLNFIIAPSLAVLYFSSSQFPPPHSVSLNDAPFSSSSLVYPLG
jgi:hypothetical protein